MTNFDAIKPSATNGVLAQEQANVWGENEFVPLAAQFGITEARARQIFREADQENNGDGVITGQEEFDAAATLITSSAKKKPSTDDTVEGTKAYMVEWAQSWTETTSDAEAGTTGGTVAPSHDSSSVGASGTTGGSVAASHDSSSGGASGAGQPDAAAFAGVAASVASASDAAGTSGRPNGGGASAPDDSNEQAQAQARLLSERNPAAFEAAAFKEYRSLITSGEPVTPTMIYQKPHLKVFIEDTLGYSSSKDFVQTMQLNSGTGKLIPGINGNGQHYNYEAVLSPAGQTLAEREMSQALSQNAHVYTLSANGPKPTIDAPIGSSYVRLESQNGPIMFTGPAAVQAAQEFAEIYSSSPTFQQAVDTQIESEGSYTVHTIQETPALKKLGGYTTSISTNEQYVVWKEPDPDNTVNSGRLGLARTMPHELVHNMYNVEEHSDSDSDSEHHDRDQTLLLGQINHELHAAGSSAALPVDTDDDDYSDNALIFSQNSGNLHNEQGDYTEIRAKYGDTYSDLRAALQEPPDFAAAQQILNSVDEEVTYTTTDAEKGEKFTQTANVKDLMLQELMLEDRRPDTYGGIDQFEGAANDNVSQFLTYLYQSAKPQHREQVAGRIQAAADATGTDISEFTRLTRSEATDNLSVQNDDGTFNGTVVSNDGRQETRYRNATRTASGAIEGGTQHTQSAAFWDAHDEAVSHGMYNVFHDTYQNDPNGSQWSADLGHFEAGNPSYSAVPMSEEAAEVLVGMNTMPNTPPNSWTHLDLVKAIENNQVIWSNGQYEAA